MSNKKNVLCVINGKNGDLHSLYLVDDHQYLVVETKTQKIEYHLYVNSEDYVKSLTSSRWVIDNITKEQLKTLAKLIKTHKPFVFDMNLIKSGIVFVDVLFNFDKFEVEYDFEFNEYNFAGESITSSALIEEIISIAKVEIKSKIRYYQCKNCKNKFVSEYFSKNDTGELCPNRCGNHEIVDISNIKKRKIT